MRQYLKNEVFKVSKWVNYLYQRHYDRSHRGTIYLVKMWYN